MLYVDSNIFIYPAIYDQKIREAKKSKEFLTKIASGQLVAYTSTLSWDEVVWIVRKIDSVDASLKVGRLLLNFPHLRFLGINRNVVLRAQGLMEKYELKPRDSIHAASALENGITTIISYDKDFDRVKELKRTEP